MECGDWLRGRLDADAAGAMAAHERACRGCTALAAEERYVLAIVARDPVPALRGDLTARVIAGIENPVAATRTPDLRGRRFAFAGLRSLRWVVAGAAAGLVMFLAMRPAQIVRTTLAHPEDERRVVEMIAATEPVRYVEADASGYEPTAAYDTQRVLLVGDGDW